MRQELDDALCQRYPLIFAERGGDPAATAMCWGFETGDGWYPLIDELCRALQRETDEEGAPQVVASQVKSKGGSLRFHISFGNERQRAMVDFSQAISHRICERCGSMRQSSWTDQSSVDTHSPLCA